MNILVCDDHAVLRRGIRDVLREHLSPVNVVEASDGIDMLAKIPGGCWHLFLMDITMPGRNGTELIVDLQRVCPSTPVLVFSVHPEAAYALQMLRAGARGYLTKATSPEELVTAVKTIVAGRRYISPSVAECLMETFHAKGNTDRAGLSQREFQTLRLLASGRSLKEIATEFGVSANTISTYRLRLMEKLGMSSNAELTRYALEHDLLE